MAGMAKPITLSHRLRSGGWESMISANGGLPAHRYTPQVTQRWPRGSEPASIRADSSQAFTCHRSSWIHIDSLSAPLEPGMGSGCMRLSGVGRAFFHWGIFSWVQCFLCPCGGCSVDGGSAAVVGSKPTAFVVAQASGQLWSNL